MSNTPIFGFRLSSENDSEKAKSDKANENALIAEALHKGRVESRSISDPPVSPSNAQMWIVPAVGTSPAPTGAWVGHEDEIALYYNGWLFVAPVNGPVFYVADEDLSVKYDDTASPSAWVVGGASTFIGQSDTPASYSGQAGKAAVVNSGETALEFGAAPGGGTWTLIDSHDFGATPASEFDVTGIDAYSEIHIYAVGLDASTITPVRMRLSTNGGSTFLSGASDYQHFLLASTGAQIAGDDDNGFQLNGGGGNAGGQCVATFRGMGVAGFKTSWIGMSSSVTSPQFASDSGFATVAAVHDAIRFYHSNATNLNAGSIEVWGR